MHIYISYIIYIYIIYIYIYIHIYIYNIIHYIQFIYIYIYHIYIAVRLKLNVFVAPPGRYLKMCRYEWLLHLYTSALIPAAAHTPDKA